MTPLNGRELIRCTIAAIAINYLILFVFDPPGLIYLLICLVNGAAVPLSLSIYRGRREATRQRRELEALMNEDHPNWGSK